MFEVIKNKPIVISVPSIPLLDTPEGFALSETEIKPIMKAMVSGPQKILIAIPDDRPIFTPMRDSRTIRGAFFTGLFQDFLFELREECFPQLKHQAARESMRVVAGNEKKELTTDDIAGLIFNKPWKTYADLEDIFWQKVSIGLSHVDGTSTIAEIGPGREHLTETDSENGSKLFHWIYQVARGLDAAFSADLKFDITSRAPVRRPSIRPPTSPEI